MGKVLFLTSTFPRWPKDATAPFVLHLAADLRDCGWDIQVLAPHAPGTKRIDNIDGIPVRRFRYLWPEMLETVCYDGGALQNLRKNRLNALKLPFLVMAELLVALRLAQRGRFDIIHSHWILPQGFVAGLVSRIYGVPHVLTVHGGDAFSLRGKVLRAFKWSALGLADAVTVNGSATRRAVLDIYPHEGSVRYIPMGTSLLGRAVDSDVRPLREEFRRPGGPLIIFVGRLIPEKGVDDLLRAVSLLSGRLTDATCLIVGDGPDRTRLEALSNDLGIRDRISFRGWVQQDALPAYLQAADIFVGPSRTGPDGWTEAQGLTFAEAMLSGLPVVATRTGGIPDNIRHEETGLLVNEGSPAGIADAVARLVTDPALLRQLAEAGQAHAEEYLTRVKTTQRFSGLYRELLASRAGGV